MLSLEPDPDFSFDPATRPYKAGVRPFRTGSYRLETDQNTIPGKLLVHNYGHGGAGITMSWGCAEIVRDIIRRHGSAGGVAVLGAGVMGLTVAKLLREENPPVCVTVYAQRITPFTTSDVAGGQWSPSMVDYYRSDPTAREAYFDILRRARKAHLARGPAYGVSERPNYTPIKLTHLDELPVDIVCPTTPLDHLPFVKLRKPGFKYDLLLVETHILMKKLHDAVASLVERRTFTALQQVAELRQAVIVNCTGLGSRSLFNDTKMVPIKGQLVRLRPQLNLKYLFSGDGQVFPRSDALIVGSKNDRNVDNETIEDAACEQIVRTMKRLFAGQTFMRALTRPTWLSVDE